MLGVYCVNKASGENSTYVVSKIKHITNEKCGHFGTLDPLASGVLPVAVGKATKLFDYFLTKDKKYFAIAKFGIETDTLDSQGEVVIKNEKQISLSQIQSVINKFIGKIKQVPPQYSAININGERAYELARQGKQAQIKPREIEIFSLSVSDYGENMFSFEIHCSAGTYVRTLISDIAKELGTVATTVCIIRRASGKFLLENSYTLSEIESGKAELLSIDKVLDLPIKSLSEEQSKKLLNGQTITTEIKEEQTLCYLNDKPIGICTTKNNSTKIQINLWEENK
ncbi:MAG: tRNA pseudouridine(55) synthase TruB [Clostridia bacterium]|nr:tRNA pseudouridine(55) synthase TruB [Clostridia bacterium]